MVVLALALSLAVVPDWVEAAEEIYIYISPRRTLEGLATTEYYYRVATRPHFCDYQANTNRRVEATRD